MIGVHVSEDAGRGFGQRVRCSMFVVSSLDPSHHAKATHIVEVDGLEPEEAEVGEAYPVAAVFMASKVLFSNRSCITLWYRFGRPSLASTLLLHPASKKVGYGARYMDCYRFSLPLVQQHNECGPPGPPTRRQLDPPRQPPGGKGTWSSSKVGADSALLALASKNQR